PNPKVAAARVSERKRLGQDFIAITPFLLVQNQIWWAVPTLQFIHRCTGTNVSSFISRARRPCHVQPCSQFGLFFGGHGVVMLGRRIFSTGYIGEVTRESFAERSSDVGEGG